MSGMTSVEGKSGDLQVCTDSSLILVAKPLVHILVHKRGLSDTGNASQQRMSEQKQAEENIGY